MVVKTRRELFEEIFNMYRVFNPEIMKKTKPLCKKALNQPEEELKAEFEDLLKEIEIWLEYDKRRSKKKRI
jgi:hypothetical protein